MKNICNLIILSILIIGLACLSGCAVTRIPMVKMNQIETIQKDITQDQVHQMIGAQSEKTVTVTYNKEKYLAEYVNMITGAQLHIWMVAMSAVPDAEDVTRPYVFLYKMQNNIYRLLTWGFVSELNKAKDITVRMVMKQVEIKANQKNN